MPLAIPSDAQTRSFPIVETLMIGAALCMLAIAAAGCGSRTLGLEDDLSRNSPSRQQDPGPLDMGLRWDLATKNPDLAGAPACPAAASPGAACSDTYSVCLYQALVGAAGYHAEVCVCKTKKWECGGGPVGMVGATKGCPIEPPSTAPGAACLSAFSSYAYCTSQERRGRRR